MSDANIEVTFWAGTFNLNKNDVERFKRKFKAGNESECWEWMAGRGTRGYGHFSVGRQPAMAHRVSHAIFIGPVPIEMCVRHRCDNPPCVNPSHLVIGTRFDNMRDMIERGRSLTGDKNPSRIFPEKLKRGEDQHLSKLTESDVRAIRSEYIPRNRKFSQLALSKKFGVTKANIRYVLKRRTWAHVL